MNNLLTRQKSKGNQRIQDAYDAGHREGYELGYTHGAISEPLCGDRIKRLQEKIEILIGELAKKQKGKSLASKDYEDWEDIGEMPPMSALKNAFK